MSERIIDAQGAPGGKASTGVAAPEAGYELGEDVTESARSVRSGTNISWSADDSYFIDVDAEMAKIRPHMYVNYTAYDELCQRVTELEIYVEMLMKHCHHQGAPVMSEPVGHSDLSTKGV